MNSKSKGFSGLIELVTDQTLIDTIYKEQSIPDNELTFLGALNEAPGCIKATGLPKNKNNSQDKQDPQEQIGKEGVDFDSWPSLLVAIVILIISFMAMSWNPSKNSDSNIKHSTSKGINFSKHEEMKNKPKRPVELKPQYGTDHLLGLEQIAWCLAQKIRLDEAGDAIDSYYGLYPKYIGIIYNFNLLTDEYSELCGSSHYKPSDLSRVKKALEPFRVSIKAEGMRFITSNLP